jgi:hypothetical protein
MTLTHPVCPSNKSPWITVLPVAYGADTPWQPQFTISTADSNAVFTGCIGSRRPFVSVV